MSSTRTRVLLAIGKGVAVAAGLTLACMLLTAAVIVFVSVSDEALVIVNQIVKIVSVAAGAFLAARANGRRGLMVGACVGILYMVIGCGLYAALLGGALSGAAVAGEMAIGAVAGALAGIMASNLPERRKRVR